MEDAKTVQDFAHLIEETRKKHKVRQQDLADLAGVSCRFLSNLENGKATVELGKVLAVLASLGLEVKLASRDEKIVAHGR